ncbi:type II toxin-antitoxin system RelE family toxin [Acetobacterium bakii]|uniref:RelE/StbE family addiction module toxin n=1 Tax=Acetobacterium bakii TaxID=52689 RepID=A0A0L6U139_9FIRM|nr:type II toxin-antitoxin system RelE/ParE family toxin [Acetobacterium bakii]KNZ42057.1 RelE/StbE family addiction module toxin [Acetobacterium bakii]
MFIVEFSDATLKKLKKMDRYQASILIGWIEKNLENCDNPRIQGKPLTANHSGKWRYRVGDYRILALIEDERIKIVIIDIGHRSEIY